MHDQHDITMASLKYFLKDPESKKDSLIHLIFQYGYFEIDPKSGRKKYKFLKMSTGEKIDPKFWNQAKCRARESRSFPQHVEFNTRLDNIETVVLNNFRTLINDGAFPSPSKLKQEVVNELNGNKPSAFVDNSGTGFFDFIQLIIDESSTGKRLTPGGKHYSGYTIKSYVSTRNHFKDFQKYLGGRIDFDSIDMKFYNAFVSWFYSKNKAKNTLGKQIKNLKVFMAEAFERGISRNMIFKSKKFKVPQEESDTIYLTNEELDQMLALDLSENPRLDLTRDYFLLDCYIGLRIADFNNLKDEHIIEIQNRKMISINLQKTETPVIIPLNKNALEILQKRNFEIKTKTEQAMNRRIKVLGKMAGIDEDVTTTITRGGKRVSEVKKKYDLISNHTARRSFATNLYLAKVPTLAIMKMTGHKTEKSFLKYIRVTPEENAVNIAQHPYFAL